MSRFQLFYFRTINLVSLALVSTLAHATNGMNMEGYGPVAMGMGGASAAYDNGTAAMMNNPATLGLMDAGSRAELFVGFLGPDVTAEAASMEADSEGTAYYMPAFGWVRKQDRMTFGVGIYGQGGMGTEYDRDTFLGDPGGIGARLENRSELSVGRVIAPLAWNVNSRLVVGGSADLVWAGLDLKMAMSEAQFVDLVTTQTIGEASGSLLAGFGAQYEPFGAPVGPGSIRTLDHAYFNFSDDSDFTGEAKAYGFAGKIGFVYQATPDLSVGATYHSKTRLGDLKTDNATLLMGVEVNTGSGYASVDIPVRGKIKVDDFQWPATWVLGMKFQATSDLQLVFDVKRLLWEDVMKDFTMEFTADNNQPDPAAADFAGADLVATLYQDWEDQTVYQVGGAYRFNRALTLRAGYNYAANPVPDQFLNALFPAIAENHITAGFGYRFDDSQSIDFSVVKVFENSATNPGNGSTIPPVKSTHGQLNFQFLYTRRY